ncbi:MAG: hypothetical protein ACI9YB_003059 [Halioglobus sp.]|jgi:hypothetical protein
MIVTVIFERSIGNLVKVFSRKTISEMKGCGISNKLLLFTRRYNEGMKSRNRRISVLEVIKSVSVFSSHNSTLNEELFQWEGVKTLEFTGVERGIIGCHDIGQE